MRTVGPDDEAVDRAMFAYYRGMPPAQRLKIVMNPVERQLMARAINAANGTGEQTPYPGHESMARMEPACRPTAPCSACRTRLVKAYGAGNEWLGLLGWANQ